MNSRTEWLCETLGYCVYQDTINRINVQLKGRPHEPVPASHENLDSDPPAECLVTCRGGHVLPGWGGGLRPASGREARPRMPIAVDNQASQQSARTKRDRLMEIYLSEAAEYTIYRDASRKERVELRREPVYVWTNPVRAGGQDGALYVWTCRGRAGSSAPFFFSFPAKGPRRLYHEFHSLSLTVLDVQRA